VMWMWRTRLCAVVVSLCLAAAGTASAGEGDTAEEKAVPAESSGTGRLRLTVEDAVIMALDHNRAFMVERLTPSILETLEEEARAVFDPVVDGGVSFSREKGPLATGPETTTDSAVDVDLGASVFYPTGTTLGLDLAARRAWTDRTRNRYTTRAGLSITQALLRGRGLEVNLAALRQAELGTRASFYELRGVAEALAAGAEELYWDTVLARRQLQIFEESVKLAEQELEETREIIRVGRMAETELVAAEAEIALRRQELIEARNILAETRLRFLRVINPPGPNLWDRDLEMLDRPAAPDIPVDPVADHVAVALRMRPDLNQARLDEENGRLEVVRTKNGLLPRLDVFAALGKTGYADSLSRSVDDLSGDHYDALAGLRFEFPVGNRERQARHLRATLSREQLREAMNNLSQLVELDVRTAYLAVQSAREQIEASRASRQLEEEKVRIETERFRVGRSTSFLVAQAQRDLVRSRILEISAVVDHLKALVDLHRLDGSLLERWGIQTPGVDPTQPVLPPDPQ